MVYILQKAQWQIHNKTSEIMVGHTTLLFKILCDPVDRSGRPIFRLPFKYIVPKCYRRGINFWLAPTMKQSKLPVVVVGGHVS